jgi:hypothetical protein
MAKVGSNLDTAQKRPLYAAFFVSGFVSCEALMLQIPAAQKGCFLGDIS